MLNMFGGPSHIDTFDPKPTHSRAIGKSLPIAGLPTNSKGRGLLDETLVIWGGEFGRPPTAENADGRDHNPHGFTMWLAGCGIKAGLNLGRTDEYGYSGVEDKVHFHDLYATILHLLGLDDKKLAYRYSGSDFRLTGVYGEVVDRPRHSGICEIPSFYLTKASARRILGANDSRQIQFV